MYHKHAANEILTCPACRKSNDEYEMNSPGMPPGGANCSRPAFAQQKDATSQSPFKVSSQNASRGSTALIGNEKEACKNKEVTEQSKPNKNFVHVDRTDSSKRSRKKRKMASESSESCDTLEDDGDNVTGNNLGDFGNWYPRWTTRSKQCVSVVRTSSMMNKRYTTISLDDMRSSKKAVTEPDNNARQNPSCNDTPVSLEIPEPEFYNFDAEKSTEKFQVGQIWAIYSDEDALP